jgi:tetratricopeptide (TPR) repeat protein
LDEAGEFYLGALALAEKHGPKDGELANSARWNLQTVLGEAPQFPSPEASTVLSSEMLIENFRHRALELERKGHRREAMDLIQSASSLAFQTDAPAIVQGLLLQQLSGIKYSLGDYQEALSVAQRGFSLTKAKLAGHHPVNVALRMTMALAARYLGDVRLALEHLANIANEPGDGVYPGFRALASTHLGTCYRMLGRLSEAERFHNLAIRIESERGEGASWICGLGQSNLGVVYREMNQLDRAEKAYKTALKTTIAATGGASSQTAEIQANLGMLFLAQNRPDAADRHLQASLDIRRTLLGENSPQTAHSLYGLSQLRLSQGRLDDAVSLATEAVRIRSQSLGENHPSTLRAKAVLEQIRIIGTR